jgi:prepilin-type N-terminal cleavage/methylation domain-containing protein
MFLRLYFSGAREKRLFQYFNRGAGFTLLELMLSVTLLSFVALIIGSGFHLGIKAWEKGEAETLETQRLRILSGLISQQLKSVYPYKTKTEDEDDEFVIFEGDENSLLFATTHVAPSSGGFRWVRYAYDDGKLTFTEGILPDKKFLDKIDEDEEVIDSDIGEVKFEYLPAPDEEWQESWDLGEGIPVAVRVKVAYFQPFLITVPMALDTGD